MIATTVHVESLAADQKTLRNVTDLAPQADVTFVGIGTVDETAALLRDGFVRADEVRALVRAGAVGEITGWTFDPEGAMVDGLTNDRVLSVPLEIGAERSLVWPCRNPVSWNQGRTGGKLVNGLITNETMAGLLLESERLLTSNLFKIVVGWRECAMHWHCSDELRFDSRVG